MSPNPAPISFPPRPTTLAWILLREMISPGDTVIDATAGNGHDTVFLAECVGASGKVLAFDIQEAAIDSTSMRVREHGFEKRVTLHHRSHECLSEFTEPGSVAAIMFNLGYLPGEDHHITTQSAGTLRALESAALVLKSGGSLSIICYPGHEAGASESQVVENWLTAKTREGWRVANYALRGTLRPAPFLLIARKA